MDASTNNPGAGGGVEAELPTHAEAVRCTS